MARRNRSGNTHDWTKYADALAMFLIRVQEMTDRKYFTIVHAVHLGSHRDQPKLPPVDEEIFISYLVVVRQFMLNDSPVALDYIRNACRKVAAHFERSDWAAHLQSIEAAYKLKARRIFRLVGHPEDQRVYKDHEMLDLFLNTKYFHSDPRGYRLIYGLQPKVIDRLRWDMQWYLYNYCNYVRSHAPLIYEIWSSRLLPSGIINLEMYPHEEGWLSLSKPSKAEGL